MLCKTCKDDYDAEDIRYGHCPDCLDNFQSQELEDQFEQLMEG